MGGERFALARSLVDQRPQRSSLLLERGKAPLRLAHRLRQVGAAVLGAGADQLEQAHALVGQRGDLAAAVLEQRTALGQSRCQFAGRRRKVVLRLSAL